MHIYLSVKLWTKNMMWIIISSKFLIFLIKKFKNDNLSVATKNKVIVKINPTSASMVKIPVQTHYY